MFGEVFRGKKVLLTGHTGFKGSWLTRWLLHLGADVTGLALPPETEPSLFDLIDVQQHIRHNLIDIRDAAAVSRIVETARPEIVLHLAAQPLVRLSYREPKATWDVNVGGTINLLEAIRKTGSVQACVVVTSDKCYENHEQIWGYRECDEMGGHDPYSSSKGATELAVSSWRRSFFSDPAGLRIATARAGNVIGGGDWAADRIVVDFVKSIKNGTPLTLRNPGSTRPWQHVIEPLSGYLHLAMALSGEDGPRYCGPWNFGPKDENILTVKSLADGLVAAWGKGEVIVNQDPGQPHEAGLLKLDCTKALGQLGWHGVWGFEETVRRTADWYKGFYQTESPVTLTDLQIQAYKLEASKLHLAWAK